MILADGALGQMMEPVDFELSSKREIPEKTWATNGTFGKRKNNIINSLYMNPNELEQSIIDRYKRYARGRREGDKVRGIQVPTTRI